MNVIEKVMSTKNIKATKIPEYSFIIVWKNVSTYVQAILVGT